MGNTVTLPTCCWRSQFVRVVNPEGKVLIYSAELLSVYDVLRAYPHHYLTDAGQERMASRGSMLRHEEVLKPGYTYLLAPLPRLFTVKDSRPAPRPRVSYCCFRIAVGESGRFSLWKLSNDSYEQDVGSLSSRKVTKIEDTNPQTVRSHSAVPIGLQEVLESEEIEWKEIVELSKTWRPDLESIKEEKSPLHHQTLESLLRGEERGERG